MPQYLVVYESATGTTAEIAEHIAERLRARGLEAQAISVEEAAEPASSPDTRYILASPVNGMRALPRLREYAQQCAAANAGCAGVFLVSAIYPAGRAMWRKAIQGELDHLATELSTSHKACFGGRLAAPMPAFPNFLFGLKKSTPLDQRDWPAIDAWADSVT